MKKTILTAFVTIAILITASISCKVNKPIAVKAPPDPCEGTSITYRAKMKSIIDAKCAGCHKEGKKAGNNGKVFTSMNDMRGKLGDMFHEAVETKEMPPEKATQLTPEEIQAWKCWQKNSYQE